MSWRRTHLWLIFLTVWLLAIALPSLRFDGGFTPFRQNLSELRAFPETQDKALMIIAVLLVMGIVFLAWQLALSLWKKARRKKEPPEMVLYIERPPTPWQVYLILILLFLGVAGLVQLARQHPHFLYPDIPTQYATHSPADQKNNNPLAVPPAPTKPADVPQAPNLDWFSYILGIVLFIALCWILRIIFKSWRKKLELSDLKEVVQIAGKALADLETGTALPDVVLRCYRDMSVILGRKVNFRKAMTAREFEKALHQAGVSENAVATLTGLFERVRYGGFLSGPKDRAVAISALKAIEQKYKEADHAV